MRSRRFRWPWIAGLTLICLAAGRQESRAKEEIQQFVVALRENGYFDEAIAYLDQMRTSSLAPTAFREAVDYEQAMTRIDASRAARIFSDRQQWLLDAKTNLNKFLAEHPQHALVASAHSQLADLQAELGRIKTEQGRQFVKGTDQRRLAMEAARGLYREADAAFAALEKRIEEAIKTFGFVDPKDRKRSEERQELRRRLLEAQLARAWLLYEIAETHDQESPENKSGLTEAAKRFAELFEKNGNYLAGLYARIGEARCYRELGRAERAFGIFEELLTWPDNPPSYRAMKNRAMVQLLETAMAPKLNRFKEALDAYQNWEATSRGKEASSEEGLAIKYLASEVALASAKGVRTGDPDEAKQRSEGLEMARRNLAFVARFPGPYRQKAKTRLLDPDIAGPAAKMREPSTFAEARDRGKAAMERMAAAEAEDRIAQAEKNAENHRACAERIEAARAEAIKYYRLALGMTAEDAPAEELQLARYHLAYLDYSAGNLDEAAKLGEDLARQDAKSPTAREGAKVALAAYDAMLRQTPTGPRAESAAARLVALANLVLQRWPDPPEADEARLVLIQAAVAGGRWQSAVDELQRVRPDSARRGDAELIVGQAIWRAYLLAARQPDAERPPQDRLEKMAADARQVLLAGVDRMRKRVEGGSPVSQSLAASVLSLAQLCLGTGEPDQAIRWLEDPRIGAKTLVDAGNPAVQQGGLPVETYKAALRAYVAARQLDKAERAMQELEKMIQKQGDAEANKRLTQIYISLGRDLQDQVERLRNQNKAEELARVLRAFESFLEKIASRKEGNTFSSLEWVAETRFAMGGGFDPGGGPLPAEAGKYYKKAAEMYRTILGRCAAEKSFAPQPEAVVAVQIRLAGCLRRLGDFREAHRLLVEVLKQHATMVDAQIEAAYTYQSWGEEKPEYFDLAIKGSELYREIWGWGKLARELQSNPKYLDTFHEARYNLAFCRLRFAQSTPQPDERGRLLERAENDIRIVQRLYPEMGGQRWRDRYDELFKRIQSLRGQKPVGLHEAATKKTP